MDCLVSDNNSTQIVVRGANCYHAAELVRVGLSLLPHLATYLDDIEHTDPSDALGKFLMNAGRTLDNE